LIARRRCTSTSFPITYQKSSPPLQVGELFDWLRTRKKAAFMQQYGDSWKEKLGLDAASQAAVSELGIKSYFVAG
jgi:hypothetical protein